MGRLVLNVLLSFAQFEREIISERTRDKMAATRRKGKWTGGRHLLGYDLDPLQRRLVVNEDEARRIRDIFTLLLNKQSLWPVVAELHRRGWQHKAWTTRAGIERGGEPFTTVSVQRLLTNPIYIGKVGYQGELHDGEHPAIIDTATWHKVQAILARRARSASTARSPSGALLQGLLYCRACGGLMTPTHTSRHGKRYRYYVCRQTWKHPSGKSLTVAAASIESVVLDQLARRQHGSAQILGTLIARIDFDGPRRQVTIHFHDPAAEPVVDLGNKKRVFHVASTRSK